MNQLAELFVKISTDMSGLTNGLKDAKKQTEMFGENYKKVGLGMMAVGAGITASLLGTAKAAETERVGIQKLSAAMKNAGVQYDDVKDSLEDLILTQQRKTGIADDKQRDALRALIVTTGDYKKSLENLNLVMDLSVAKDMDVATAAELIGKVMMGEFGTLTRYGIILKEDATIADALAAIQDRVAGSAEAARSPLEVLQARLGDLAETVGSSLAPRLNELLDKYLIPIVDKMVDWIEKNPGLVNGIVLFAGVLVGVGGLLFALNAISKAIIAVNAALIIMHGLTGVGLLKAGIGLAAAGGMIWGMNEMINNSSNGVPGLAGGGIVNSPTLAMIGESGPEAVMPLNQMNNQIQLFIDGEQITNVIEKRMYRNANSYGVRGYV